jgi:dienelactone hydrolase
MRRLLLAAGAALALQGAAAADVHVEMVATDGPAATLRLSLPEGLPAPFGVVILLPDSLGADRRSKPYLDRLASYGLATLEVELAEPTPGDAPPIGEQLDGAVVQALGFVAQDGRLDATRIGLLGFGAGGRAVLRDPRGLPGVALYPGCDLALGAPAARILLLHGELEEGAASCPANVRPEAGGLAISMAGATAAWDAPHSILSDALTLWPHPSGQGRSLARPSDAATAASAALALDWLAPLKPPAR